MTQSTITGKVSVQTPPDKSYVLLKLDMRADAIALSPQIAAEMALAVLIAAKACGADLRKVMETFQP